MSYEELIKKEKVEIGGRKFAISSIPCVQSHAIWNSCIKSMDGKVSTFGFSHLPMDIVLSIMGYVAVNANGAWTVLEDEDEINRHVSGEDELQQLVLAMCKKNFGFFFDGSLFLWLGLLEGKESLE